MTFNYCACQLFYGIERWSEIDFLTSILFHSVLTSTEGKREMVSLRDRGEGVGWGAHAGQVDGHGEDDGGVVLWNEVM